MTFGDAYIKHMEVLVNVGMTGIHPVMHKGVDIIPIEFLKTLLPEPGTLGADTKGKTCIGNWIEGTGKDGQPSATTCTTSATTRSATARPTARASATPPASPP
jgi:saccharopine dehydrogenase-like NADP-dependent oxidoreductase